MRKIKLGWEKEKRDDCYTRPHRCKVCRYGAVPGGGPNCLRCNRSNSYKYWWPPINKLND
jgi:hypothetical protein